MIIIPFLNLVLEKEEGLNKSGQSLMSCIVFIGMASGSMCSGFWGWFNLISFIMFFYKKEILLGEKEQFNCLLDLYLPLDLLAALVGK